MFNSVFFLTIAWSGYCIAADPAPSQSQGRHALLIGCTTYANLSASLHLQGPANDVLLMRDLLTSRFRFSREDVVILAEAQGTADLRPTRANIEREFRLLATEASEGDRVFILMSGHGSQQPDQDPPGSEDSEPDGFDEIFLPADIGTWDGGSHTVENAIVDDELREWVKAIRRQGAEVWIVLDACHSGTMIRGGADEVRRDVPDSLLVPEDVRIAATQRAATNLSPRPPESALHADTESGIVAIYASQANETTVEKQLPAGSADRKPYGLLTYTLNEVLSQSSTPLSYDELVDQVRRAYIHLGRTSPTPLVEGVDRFREVLGSREWFGRPIHLRTSSSGLKLDAGALQGLTTSSVLAVSPAGGLSTESPTGYVRISELRTLEAVVEPCEFEGHVTNPLNLPDNGVCEVVFVDYGDMRLRVAVDTADNAGRPTAEATREALTKTLSDLDDEAGARFQVATDPTQAEWLVRQNNGRTYLLPSSGVAATELASEAESPTLPNLFGPAPDDQPVSVWLRDTLQQIARVDNLRRLATQPNPTASATSSLQVSIGTRLLQGADDTAGILLDTGRAGIELHDGDAVLLELHNPNSVAIDVTLLYLDSGYGITCLFPTDSGNRLRAGESLTIGPVDVVADTIGQEHLIAITVAVPTGTIQQPADFSPLAQPSLTLAQDSERTRGGSTALDSPLGELLTSAMYAEGATRGLVRRQRLDHGIELHSFQISPSPRASSSTE